MGIRLSAGIGPVRISVPLSLRGRRRYVSQVPGVAYSARARDASWLPVIIIGAVTFVGVAIAVVMILVD